ncbi:hypothetical protein N7509_002444 [Penicillium cosmopolitanum]|uniref:Glycogen debranching enzyme n=1 Tax=Penicillium cosmopolitanum TaxID=1131564 RepID=A0A9W9W8V2_9EURO|nr:uncharacterized protein N7509_002444 [Penicillium cosmopolitanum]KAJ5408561.1 hypothetical protein N7509_002444 [Penicillium cosmopolitanum]
MKFLQILHLLGALGASARAAAESDDALSLDDLPYKNYFYSDCNVAAQAVVTSPLPDSNLSIIGPRLIVAWPAGNSGVCTFFAPQTGENGTLAIELINSTDAHPLSPVYNASSNGPPHVGIQGVLRFNSSAKLTVPILGSIRTIRDFVEGPSLLYPEIQDAVKFSSSGNGSVSLQRTWLDNTTMTTLTFQPWINSTSKNDGGVSLDNRTVAFEAGDYLFSATINYPELTPLKPAAVLNNASNNLATTMSGQTTALSFLSYSEKLLAGAWRFLTYFGRDSMIATLLLEPVLSYGEGSATEAVIGAVLERINRTDGTVCHEETIGDYATWTNEQENITSTAMGCDYKMVDSDYYLPVLMQRYFVENPIGQKRAAKFFNTTAGSVNPANKNLTWGDLALTNAERIMRLAGPFVKNQTKENLIHLHEDQIVGEWRDSTYGLGGGRIPYDVNTALVPAGLRSIGALSRAGILPGRKQWGSLADKYAKVWEDNTLDFFSVTIPQSKAKSLVTSFSKDHFAGPNQSSAIDTDVTFHAVALDGYNNLSKVEVMNTDDCFRHFLLNTTNDEQLTPFLNGSATNIRRTFPAGLMTDVGMIVANPAFGEDPVYAQNFTTGAYHGTVVWSWQLAMMARGLELQLGRCEVTSNFSVNSESVKRGHNSKAVMPTPEFCTDDSVYTNVRAAYNVLWDSIEKNEAQLSSEVWSWVYRNGSFQVTPLGVLPAPPGVGGQTGK